MPLFFFNRPTLLLALLFWVRRFREWSFWDRSRSFWDHSFLNRGLANPQPLRRLT